MTTLIKQSKDAWQAHHIEIKMEAVKIALVRKIMVNYQHPYSTLFKNIISYLPYICWLSMKSFTLSYTTCVMDYIWYVPLPIRTTYAHSLIDYKSLKRCI